MEYGLIGETLKHSYSAEIHEKLGGYKYELLEIKSEKLEEFFRKREFKAINVTIPYKETVIPYLDWISDTARRIGAVNTIVNRGGKLYGYNTDFAGMKAQINAASISLEGKKTMILGTGGTSKTAHAVAQSLGASGIITVSRSGKDGALTYEEAMSRAADAEIIINATPCGMYPHEDGCPIDLSLFSHPEGVTDAIYNPLRTNLILDAAERNVSSAGGLYMLTAQAVYGSSLFLDREAQVNDIDRVYRQILDEKQNIVLIGMPSCGKSSIGCRLAALTGKTFIDTDTVITDRIQMTIADFFAKKGEAEFRRIESEAISELSRKTGCILATGGGAVLNPANVRALKRNGFLVFIDRSPDLLSASADRPLSSDREAVMRLYNARYDIYRSSADIIINGDGTVEEVAEAILEKIK